MSQNKHGHGKARYRKPTNNRRRFADDLPAQERMRRRPRQRMSRPTHVVTDNMVHAAKSRIKTAIRRIYRGSVLVAGGKATVQKFVKAICQKVGNGDKALGRNIEEARRAMIAAAQQLLDSREILVVEHAMGWKYMLTA